MNLLLSGPPRVGKTTLVKNLIKKLSEKEVIAGFYTEEIREGGKREGFKLITLEGREGIFAHCSLKSPYKLGKYGVDIAAFEKLGLSILEEALAKEQVRVLIIDEIGKMELMSEKFKEVLLKSFDSSKTVVATIGIQRDPFTMGLRKRCDTRIFELSKENRDELFEKIFRVLQPFLFGLTR